MPRTAALVNRERRNEHQANEKESQEWNICWCAYECWHSHRLMDGWIEYRKASIRDAQTHDHSQQCVRPDSTSHPNQGLCENAARRSVLWCGHLRDASAHKHESEQREQKRTGHTPPPLSSFDECRLRNLGLEQYLALRGLKAEHVRS